MRIQGKVHIAGGHKTEAIAALKEALRTAGLHPSQKTECVAYEQRFSAIEPASASSSTRRENIQ